MASQTIPTVISKNINNKTNQWSMSKAYNTNIKKKKNIKLMIKNIIEFPSDIIIFSLDTNFCYTAFNKNYTEYLSATFDINVKIGDNILDVFRIIKI